MVISFTGDYAAILLLLLMMMMMMMVVLILIRIRKNGEVHDNDDNEEEHEAIPQLQKSNAHELPSLHLIIIDDNLVAFTR